MIENLTDLRYFLEVAKTANITRASERLGVTQPSLTVAIQRLEGKSGTTLLDRSRKGVFLTRQGEALVKAGERMLTEWERELRGISQGSTIPIGSYTLGSHISVAQYALPETLAKTLATFTKLEFRLKHDLSRKITESVISRECDIGLVINPVSHPDLVMHKILTDEVTLFKHPQYQGDVLIFDPELKQSQSLLKKVKKSFPYEREIHSSSLDVIRSLCESKSGVAILPSRVASKTEKIKKLAHSPTFHDELYLIYRMERKSEISFKLLIEEIRRNLVKL